MSVFQQRNGDAVVFESGDKALAAELLTSSSDFCPQDVRNFANAGAISVESAKTIIANMEGSVVKMDKDAKNRILHKKALIMLARDKNDPLFNEYLELHERQESIMSELESKYGKEATVNQGSLVGKLLSKFRNNDRAMESCKKISDFQ